jgi:hypothetical protein
MKRILLIGFEGVGFRNPKYAVENGLIRAGHVGFAFEDASEKIYGFHPNPEAVKSAGGEAAVLQLLLRGDAIDGTLQIDTEVFKRAAELAESGARTQVWQLDIPVSEDEFERIRRQTLEWYNTQQVFQYAFPRRTTPLTGERDNCATFPRRLGIPLPEQSGQLSWYIEAMMARGKPWRTM